MNNKIKIKEQLLLLGDIHAGDFNNNILVIYEHIERLDLSHLTIIQVGDFGYSIHNHIWQVLNDFLKKRNINLIINRGNHDSYYNHFPKLGQPEYNKKLSNIFFLKDFDFLDWNGKKILCIGGATSIDRMERVIDESYWKQESINYSKINLSPEPDTFQEYVFQYYTKNIDIVISHTSPISFHPYLKLSDLSQRYKLDENLEKDLLTESLFLDKMINIINPKLWINGHFHQSIQFRIKNTKCRVLGINELFEVNI